MKTVVEESAYAKLLPVRGI